MSGQLRQRSVSLRNTLPRFTVPDRARRSVCFRLVRATNTSSVTPRIPAFGDWVRAIRIDRARRRCRRNIDRTAIDEHRVVHPWNLARKQAGIAVKTSSPLRREVVARDRDRPVDRTRRRYARILESLTRWLHKGVEFVAAKHSWNVRRSAGRALWRCAIGWLRIGWRRGIGRRWGGVERDSRRHVLRLVGVRVSRTSRYNNEECIDELFHAVVLSVIKPRFARLVSSDASAAFPPREPVTVGFAAGVAPKKPMVVAVNAWVMLAR